VPLVAQQQEVTVTVLNAANQPPQPVRAVRVSLSYLDSGTVVTDAQQVTNSDGEALLVVSSGVVQRGDLRMEITGATNLVIWRPADGQIPGLGRRMQIALLPKGSPALLGPAQIEAMLHRTLLQVNSLQKRVHALRGELAQSQAQGEPQGPGASLASFAEANGFTPDQVQQQVQIWAQNIRLQSAQATAEQRALAEFALKNYAAAAQTFNQAADAANSEIDVTEAEATAFEKALLDKVRNQLQKLIDDRQQAASAFQLNLEFHQATLTLQAAVATAETESRKHPEDKGLQQISLQALLAAANARLWEGQVDSMEQSAALESGAADAFRSLAASYSSLGDARDAAAAYRGEGAALEAEANRRSGPIVATLSDQAAQAYRGAIDSISKTQDPHDWAAAQNGLGNLLEDEGNRTSGDQGVPLFEQSAAAFQHALEVYTKADNPAAWSSTEGFLGNDLEDEAQRVGPDKAPALYQRSVDAFQLALEVLNQKSEPREWAVTENNLGNLLALEAQNSGGDNARAQLDQSAAAFRHALEVFTQSQVPQDWAMVQRNLGTVLSYEAMAAGPAGAVFVGQSIEAEQNALKVFTPQSSPQNWALTESTLANDYFVESTAATGDQKIALLEQAAQCFRNNLQVFTRAMNPWEWARAQSNLANILAEESFHVAPDRTRQLAAQAGDAYQQALQVYTRTSSPDSWALTEMNLLELTFRSSQFQNCLQQAATLTDDVLPLALRPIRSTFQLACQFGAGDRSAGLRFEQDLASHASSLPVGIWDFSGSLGFVSSSPAFVSGRTAWIALFTAIQNGDGTGMNAALHQLEPLLGH
jgi:tetratricopeptide (TPR) repeat protein